MKSFFIYVAQVLKFIDQHTYTFNMGCVATYRTFLVPPPPPPPPPPPAAPPAPPRQLPEGPLPSVVLEDFSDGVWYFAELPSENAMVSARYEELLQGFGSRMRWRRLIS